MNKYIVIFFALLLVHSSCSDGLKISPEQSLATADAFSDKNTSAASLNGVYSRCQDIDVFGSIPQIINDYLPQNVNFTGSFPTLQSINNFASLADNVSVGNIFRDHYRAILGANAVIHYVPNVKDEAFTNEEKAQAVGEAKYLRAILYFQMVNLFAQPYTLDNGASQGVALVLEPNIVIDGSAPLVGRSTVKEVYDQVEKDLKEAEAALADSGNKYRASKGAAQAMLARLYLYKGDWTNAASYAKAVIDNSKYTLATDYSFWAQDDRIGLGEAVFFISMTAIDNSRTGAGGWSNYYNPAPSGRGDCPFAESFYNSYDAADKRVTELSRRNPGDSTEVFTTKFPDGVNNTDDAPLQRVSELYLTRAEALARESNAVTEEIVDLLNKTRERAGLNAFSTDDFATSDALIEAIMDERRKELAFEGHYRNDLLRVGKSLRPGQGGTGPGADKVILPIPQREIDLGSSLPQNTGY